MTEKVALLEALSQEAIEVLRRAQSLSRAAVDAASRTESDRLIADALDTIAAFRPPTQPISGPDAVPHGLEATAPEGVATIALWLQLMTILLLRQALAFGTDAAIARSASRAMAAQGCWANAVRASALAIS